MLDLTSINECWDYVGGLSKPSKMPGYAYGLPASKCQTGSQLAQIPGTVCYSCYALKGCYNFPVVQLAQAKRLRSITKKYWVEAMTTLINHYCKSSGVFRWHDSGDLQSVDHLNRIVEVCKNTPAVKHWLPTREINYLQAYHKPSFVALPDNLVIRVSAHWVNAQPDFTIAANTSTVHKVRGKPVQVSERLKDSVECRAYTRGSECGPCRACWSPKVQNVSYPEH